jgi:hypothetical protein
VKKSYLSKENYMTSIHQKDYTPNYQIEVGFRIKAKIEKKNI